MFVFLNKSGYSLQCPRFEVSPALKDLKDLKDLFDRVGAGDRIGVRFMGEVESASGRSYYNFRTAMRKKKREDLER